MFVYVPGEAYAHPVYGVFTGVVLVFVATALHVYGRSQSGDVALIRTEVGVITSSVVIDKFQSLLKRHFQCWSSVSPASTGSTHVGQFYRSGSLQSCGTTVNTDDLGL